MSCVGGYDPKDHFNKETKNILIQNLRVNYKGSDELIMTSSAINLINGISLLSSSLSW